MQLTALNATIIDWKKSSTKAELALGSVLSEIKENDGGKTYQDQKINNSHSQMITSKTTVVTW